MIKFRNHSEIQKTVDVKRSKKCFKFTEAGITAGEHLVASRLLHSDSIQTKALTLPGWNAGDS